MALPAQLQDRPTATDLDVVAMSPEEEHDGRTPLDRRECELLHGTPTSSSSPWRAGDDASSSRTGTGRQPAMQDPRLGDRNDESATPRLDAGHLVQDLLLEVPGKDQDVVGLRLEDPLRSVDRDAAPRQVVALLVRAPVHGVVDEIRPDPAVVEKRVPLPGRSVRRDALAGAARVDQEVEELALRLVDPLGEPRVVLEAAHPGGLLADAQGVDRGPGGQLAALGVASVDAQRSAVGRKLLDVEEDESVAGEDLLDGAEAQVRAVLVVDRVELVALDEPHQVGELEREHALGREEDLESRDEGVEVGEDRKS